MEISREETQQLFPFLNEREITRLGNLIESQSILANQRYEELLSWLRHEHKDIYLEVREIEKIDKKT